jgi:hypothetical protein
MKCKIYQEMLVSTGSLTVKEQDMLMQHIAECPKCADFQKGITLIQEGLAGIDSPSLPKELDLKTRFLCFSQVEKKKVRFKVPIPKLIWTGLGIISIITMIWFFQSMQNFNLEEMNAQTWIVITIIFQNAMMLILAPVLIRKIKHHGNMNLIKSAFYSNISI